MSTWLLTCRQSVFKWQPSITNISKSFAHKMAAKTGWHRCGTKLRHCYPMYRHGPSNMGTLINVTAPKACHTPKVADMLRLAAAACCDMAWISAQCGVLCDWSVAISKHNSFRVLFDRNRIAAVYFIWNIYLYFSIANGQPRQPALCQLYRSVARRAVKKWPHSARRAGDAADKSHSASAHGLRLRRRDVLLLHAEQQPGDASWADTARETWRWRPPQAPLPLLMLQLLRPIRDVSDTYFDVEEDDSYTAKNRENESEALNWSVNGVQLSCCLISKFVNIIKAENAEFTF